MSDNALLVDVLVALGAGNLSLGPIRCDGEVVEGLAYTGMKGKMRGHVVINNQHNTVDTALHELIHRVRPKWSEAKVRAQTRKLMRELSDAQQEAVYVAIHSVAKVRKRAVRIEID